MSWLLHRPIKTNSHNALRAAQVILDVSFPMALWKCASSSTCLDQAVVAQACVSGAKELHGLSTSFNAVITLVFETERKHHAP